MAILFILSLFVIAQVPHVKSAVVVSLKDTSSNSHNMANSLSNDILQSWDDDNTTSVKSDHAPALPNFYKKERMTNVDEEQGLIFTEFYCAWQKCDTIRIANVHKDQEHVARIASMYCFVDRTMCMEERLISFPDNM